MGGRVAAPGGIAGRLACFAAGRRGIEAAQPGWRQTLIDARFDRATECPPYLAAGTVTRGLITKRSIHARFLHAVGHNLYVVWPVLFAVLAWQVAIGFLITWLEHWSLGDGVYFTLVTGLTIGYGDLVPHQPMSRFLAIVVGFFGTVLTGLVAAIAVRALQTAADDLT